MGSEIVAVTDEKSELAVLASLASRRRPRQRRMPTVRSMPRTRPGKKPARMAGAGKGLVLVGVGVGCEAFTAAPVGALVGVEEDEWEEVEVLVETVFDELEELVILDERDELVELKMGKVVVGSVEAEVEVPLPEVDEAVAPEVLEAPVSTFITHCPLSWHEKPCGQQSLPHLTSGPP